MWKLSHTEVHTVVPEHEAQEDQAGALPGRLRE